MALTEALNYFLTMALTEAMVRKAGGNFDLTSNIQLDLSGLDVNRVSDALEGCTNLEQVDLSHNKLKDANGFACLAQLQTLDLTANHITDFIAVTLPAAVECIRLPGNNIKAPSDLKGLETLRNLKALYLQTPNEELANPICMDKGYPECVIKAAQQKRLCPTLLIAAGFRWQVLPQLEILDGVRLKVMRKLNVVDMPEDKKVEVPPSVPWLQGFEWEESEKVAQDEEVVKATKRFDRLSKECAKLDSKAKEMLA